MLKAVDHCLLEMGSFWLIRRARYCSRFQPNVPNSPTWLSISKVSKVGFSPYWWFRIAHSFEDGKRYCVVCCLNILEKTLEYIIPIKDYRCWESVKIEFFLDKLCCNCYMLVLINIAAIVMVVKDVSRWQSGNTWLTINHNQNFIHIPPLQILVILE